MDGFKLKGVEVAGTLVGADVVALLGKPNAAVDEVTAADAPTGAKDIGGSVALFAAPPVAVKSMVGVGAALVAAVARKPPEATGIDEDAGRVRADEEGVDPKAKPPPAPKPEPRLEEEGAKDPVVVGVAPKDSAALGGAPKLEDCEIDDPNAAEGVAPREAKGAAEVAGAPNRFAEEVAGAVAPNPAEAGVALAPKAGAGFEEEPKSPEDDVAVPKVGAFETAPKRLPAEDEVPKLSADDDAAGSPFVEVPKMDGSVFEPKGLAEELPL